MSNPFDILVPTNTVKLDLNGQSVVTFTVKNLTGRRVHASAKGDGTAYGRCQLGDHLAIRHHQHQSAECARFRH